MKGTRILEFMLMAVLSVNTSCGRDEEEPDNVVVMYDESKSITFRAEGGGFEEFVEVEGHRYEFVLERTMEVSQQHFLLRTTGQYFNKPVPFTLVFKKRGCEERSVTIQPEFSVKVRYFVEPDSISYQIVR